MVNIDSLPKSIEYNGNVYFLNLHVTAWNKLCVCYQYAFSPREAMEKKIEYNILSQVVEPDMKKPINYSDNVTAIIDVPNYQIAFNVLSARVDGAIFRNVLTIYK